jgi:hypothetical protein
LELVIDAIKAERCLPFLGTGASGRFSFAGLDIPGVPLGEELCQKIADACN